ncbi:hypothetical protein [Streptomyces albireticuli]|uniref:Uncharacterized protein n=1 Tax=Streptomyces albireticuli TaxID=1940 RepID=A0A2A2DAV5_9ACTN|nr:hypothetical protein [Streptomyces albireticuli]MCD9143114.1 hypothetical protein [Streptomyces albireticuli]MCD9165357.1 hypothetical protein [Streptomyces albireticuli]MCD9192125.1 hypothetical protein [Streptomyces albireticuli]PAU48422.1 hypothetical protein CK936_13405 [Streptomyces albireticuli]
MSDTALTSLSPAHSTSTTETGSFCSARCTCGWRGPARRARSLARDDATAHAGAGSEGTGSVGTPSV